MNNKLGQAYAVDRINITLAWLPDQADKASGDANTTVTKNVLIKICMWGLSFCRKEVC